MPIFGRKVAEFVNFPFSHIEYGREIKKKTKLGTVVVRKAQICFHMKSLENEGYFLCSYFFKVAK